MKKIKALLVIISLIAIQGFSLPTGAEISLGEANLSIDKNLLNIESNSDKTIINWKDFNIEANEITNFIQPDINSIVLNKVLGNEISNIYGNLESNGKIFLLNPKGILIGKDAQINVESFFASTLDFKNIDDFENELFFESTNDSSIINLGKIDANADIYLISKSIENSGQIISKNDSVNLVASAKVLIKPKEIENIYILSDETKLTKNGIGIDNKNIIKAVKANLIADGSIYEKAIKNSGKIEANGIKNKNGEIYLVANKGSIKIDKTSMLSSKNADSTGGIINILADDISLKDKTVIDVSSIFSGGEIYIGQCEKQDEKYYNSSTIIDKHVYIKADSLQSGDGGKIVIFSDELANFSGFISSKGGPVHGNGGFIEISAKNLQFNGKIDTHADNGRIGTLYLDPTDIYISKFPTSGGSFDDGSPTDTFVVTSDISYIYRDDLFNALANSNVVISTNSAYSGTGNIYIAPSFVYIANDINSGSLSLTADNNIYLYSKFSFQGYAGTSVSLNMIAGNQFICTDVFNLNNISSTITANDIIFSGELQLVDLGDFTLNATNTINFQETYQNSLDFKSTSNCSFTAGDSILIDSIFICTGANNISFSAPTKVLFEDNRN